MLPVPLNSSTCRGCAADLDGWGYHILACTRTGMIKRRAILPELVWVQICTEARGSVKHRSLLSSLAVPKVPRDDGRELDHRGCLAAFDLICRRSP